MIIVLVVVAALIALAATGITPQRAVDSFFPVGGETPVTDRSHSVRTLYNIVFAIAVVIFILVEGLIVFTVFRYRRKPDEDDLPPQTHGNNLVEVIWTAIPTLIVAFLFVLSWQTLNTVEATGPTDVRIRAVATRFQWQFDYLDASGKTLFTQALPSGEDGGMVVPVGEPVQVTLRATDVIHAFYVPKFLFKRDAIPGRENTFDFTVDEQGTYRGQCAELCGTFHDTMVFEVHAVAKAQYDTWLQAAIAKAAATPTPAPSGAAPAPSGAAPQPSGAAPQPSAGGGTGTGPVIQLAAKNIAFSTTALQAPADTPFTIHFQNDDAGVPHNVQIKNAGGGQVFLGPNVTGPAAGDYAVPALKAGTYPFDCTIHPNMTGTLTVQ
ncbi:MAG: cytochrome c oxidase subunit II [Planctomycetaceae bacterium]